MSKTLHNSDVSGARENVLDHQVVGNGDLFRLLTKASSEEEGWMKSTKAMEIEGLGCLVQVTTQQRNNDGTYAVAEALTFVPGAMFLSSADGGGYLVNATPAMGKESSMTDRFPDDTPISKIGINLQTALDIVVNSNIRTWADLRECSFSYLAELTNVTTREVLAMEEALNFRFRREER